jgi:ParB-like chromosome segregation protein Spo0J
VKQPWKNRIVGYSDEPVEDLLAHPRNARLHPKSQQDALRGLLTEVGVVQNVLVNKRTQHVIDGHLRISLALRDGQPTVPVTWVDLDEQEEFLILASLDAVGAAAAYDREKLDDLLHEVSTGSADVQTLLDNLAQHVGVIPPNVDFKEFDESIADTVEYCECPSCGHKWPK